MMSTLPGRPLSVAAALGLIAAAIVLITLPATAQVTVVPTFEVGTAPFAEAVLSAEVAAASDGTMLFAWVGESNLTRVSTRQLSATGLPLTPTRRHASDAGLRTVLPYGGGHLLLYDDIITRGLALDAAGAPLGPSFPILSFPIQGSVALTTVPFGVATVFGFRGVVAAQVIDYSGEPIDGRETLSQGFSAASVDIAPLSNGGFVVTWIGDPHSQGLSHARLLTGVGQPYSPVFTLGASPDAVDTVAGNPQGGFTAVARRYANGNGVVTILAHRYASDTTFLGTSVLAELPPGIVPTLDVASDANGNMLVVWTEVGESGFPLGPLRHRGRGLDAAGAPLPGPFVLAEGASEHVHTAPRPDGTFVTVWTEDGKAYGKVVRLCTADVSVCGDGVMVAECEACDDGGANSDTAPDACRTACVLPRCGDGIADGTYGEECDDGNAENCDGCTRDCRIEHDAGCGDGLIIPGCGPDQCDDGNLVDGDGCTPACTLERVPGGGGPSSDCVTEWSVDNVANDPRFDTKGAFNALQVCTDDDPRCDFDGGVAGSCTFRLRVCVNNTDSDRCLAPTRVSSWELIRPSLGQAAKRPDLAAVRAALSSVPSAVVGPDGRDTCSAWLSVPLPLRGAPGAYRAGKLSLGTVARTYDARKDADKLKLLCRPAGG